MRLLEEDIRKTTPILCEIQRDYIKYMHDADWRVSVKYNNRKFVGLAVQINGRMFVVPLTSQTTKERIARGKKKRSAAITTFLKVAGEEIANLLHNNMFPVPDDQIKPIQIDPKVDTYLANEERQIRKKWVEINTKSIAVYRERYDKESRNYYFFNKTCCDFKKLEVECDRWEREHNISSTL
ncbi:MULTISPECIES: type III toxin-antitoxin system ToxN/AbiQ family toxin [Eubacteriales]|uniref:type III toxin-antitoxin system ToxN/AbiQ family toxin n=1 Tax=Eubacteriales TaxID=186802 RepID=UPI0007A9240C|nr:MULTISPECIES: type III toxin-antitoxin system ToxN/AbiQ family toxin [Clostridia]CVI72501.1 hypothetical protein BN3660_02616 [Eubacteriaceae bacterium CHKCI004]